MKTCPKCKQAKPEIDFNFKNRTRNLLQTHCKQCTRLYIRQHYLNNRDYYIKKAHTRNKFIRSGIRKYLWTYLVTHKCVDCGEKDPIVLEFDHLKDKAMAVSSFVNQNSSLARIRAEINKCEVRCANCHRRKTAIQYGWYKNLPL